MKKIKPLLFLSIPIIVLAVYNIYSYDKFWEISVSTVITASIAIYISYYFTQNRLDQRKAQDSLEKVLSKLETEISRTPIRAMTSETEKSQILLGIRRINNKIFVLKKYQELFGIVEDVKWIHQRFKDYEEFVGDHIDDMDYLSKSQSELIRPLERIDDRIDTIRIKLYT